MSAAFLTGGSKSFWSVLLVILLRYFILALVAFLFFYVIRKEAWRSRRIQQRFPARGDYWREILYSIGTAFIFAIIGYAVFLTPFEAFTQAYYNIEDHGLPYFFVSILLMILVHDTYFYWTHWLMHRKALYRLFHRVHHLSANPSPWAAMAFHPLEAVVEALVIAVIAVAFPVHPIAIGLFLLFMMLYNVYGHLGYELYPRGFSRSLVGRWINTSVNHNLHHQYVEGNYGLYFLFWDRLMKTLQPGYDEQFDEVHSRRGKARPY